MLSHRENVRTSKIEGKEEKFFSKIYLEHIRIWFRQKKTKFFHACVLLSCLPVHSIVKVLYNPRAGLCFSSDPDPDSPDSPSNMIWLLPFPLSRKYNGGTQKDWEKDSENAWSSINRSIFFATAPKSISVSRLINSWLGWTSLVWSSRAVPNSWHCFRNAWKIIVKLKTTYLTQYQQEEVY